MIDQQPLGKPAAEIVARYEFKIRITRFLRRLRRSSFLNVLLDESGFPDAFDEALSVDTVLDRAGPFIIEEEERDADRMYWQIDFGVGEAPPDPPAYWPDDVMATLGDSAEGTTENPSHLRQESTGQLDDVTIEGNAFAFDDPDDPGEVSVSFTIDDDGGSRHLHLALFRLPGPFAESEIADQELVSVVNDQFSGGESGTLSLEIPE